jgi:hypothetical protein
MRPSLPSYRQGHIEEMVSVMPAERLSCLVIKLLKSELVLDARCGTNT